LGSALGGVKAGIIAGILFAGSIGLFDIATLYVWQGDVQTAIAQNGCGTGAVTFSDCILSVVTVLVPLYMFGILLVSLFFAFLFGRFFEGLPGKTYRNRGVLVGLVLLIAILGLGLGGWTFNLPVRIVGAVFNVSMAVVYGMVLGRLYRRYTREVEFMSRDGSPLRVIVDGKNVTGKTRTLSLRSTHKLRGEAEEGASFKEWSSSGGVLVEEPKSFETSFEVQGDGVLKGAAVVRK
jgi:hypothetical protein